MPDSAWDRFIHYVNTMRRMFAALAVLLLLVGCDAIQESQENVGALHALLISPEVA
jgi:hypothetical protein